MAKTTTRKRAHVATRGSNQPPALPSLDDIRNIANSGFEDKSKADLLNGTAVQRVAYGVLALWMTWRESGHPDQEQVNDLDNILMTTDETARSKAATLRAQLAAVLIGAPIETKDLQADAIAQIKTERSNKMTLLGRALAPAAIMRKAGVTLDMFNRELGCFLVPPAVLLDKDINPVGRLDTGAPIALNNKPITGEHNTSGAMWRKRASIDQLMAAWRSRSDIKSGRGARGQNAGKVDLASVSPVKLADTFKDDIGRLVEALHRALVREANDKRPHVEYQAMDDKCWAMLADIAQENDQIQNDPAFRAAFKHGVSSASEIKSAA